jgi:glucuronoarabinoxylan endo-1,4-beta-xylanase
MDVYMLLRINGIDGESGPTSCTKGCTVMMRRLAELRPRLGIPLCVSLALSLVAAAALSQGATVTIDGNALHQTIDGFGVAQPGWDPNDVNDPATRLFNRPDRSQIMDLAFSQANGGIGLTILRMKVNPMLEPSPEVWNDYDPAQVWIMQEAVKRGPVKLIASVWSPPAWMKSNNSIIGGSLQFPHYQAFADFLRHYTGQYASTNGVNIYAVSMCNEPDTDGVNWDTCVWNSDSIATFLSRYLSPTFANNHIATQVIAPEASRWDSVDSFLTATYNNQAALARVNTVAGHLYNGSNPSLRFQNALNHGKKIWQTECSTNYPTWDLSGALSWAKTIHQGLTGAQVSAWVWFIMAGPQPEGGLILLTNPSPGVYWFSVSKTFWALGNFSKFIRPGFVRIDATTDGPAQLLTSAYKDPASGRFVIVAINTGTSDLQVNFKTSGLSYASVTPFVTSSTQDLAPQPAVSLADTLTIPAQSIVSYVAPPVVSFHKPDGMILSTGNLYFTSHDEYGAHVFRTGQTSSPGQEIELYHEPPGNRFGDIVFANVGGVYYGYFFAVNSVGQSSIKRILLTGSPVATVLTPVFNNIDIVNSHHNLATDGVNLYWQDVSSVKKMPIGGGGITTLDLTTPNTPTAGVYLSNGNVIYASVAAVRYVPTGGAVTNPMFRTIANANAPVTTLLPVANGTYWGDRNGAIQLKVGSTISTIQANTGLVPTSMGTNGYTAGGALVWTQCASSTCQLVFHFPAFNGPVPIANNALGASMNSSGNVFWGDDSGVHRLVF